MPRKGKDITDGEPGLWDLAMADVKPLPGRRKPAPEKPHEPAPRARVQVAKHVKPAAAAPKAGTKPPARDLDLRTRQKLERGQMAIESVLDLHGYGQAAAYEQLMQFLQDAHRRDMRCVLVITGKGKMGGGILRTRFPEWMDGSPLDAIVLSYTRARQNHGGEGAWYILLRRRR